jgi:hypothetical protein
VITHFQHLSIAFIETRPKLPFGYLIALCNNSNRAYEYTTEFFENKIGAVLDDRGLGIPVDQVADGFSKVAKKAMHRLIAMMMEDMTEIYPKFFMAEWYTANPPFISSIVVTLKDYFSTELSPHMLPPVFQDLSLECAKRLVKVYAGHLIEKKHPPFTAATVARMQRDVDELQAFFSNYIREKTLEELLQPLVLLRQLLEANYQLVSSYYESLLEHFPDASLNVIEVLLDNRQDLERNEVKEALAACQAVAARRATSVRKPTGGATLLGDSLVARKKSKKNKTKAFFSKLLQKF